MHELPINTRLQDGKLAVSKPLGQGGFGITYYGGDVQLRRYIAIKEFFPQGCTRHESAVQVGGVVSAAEFAAMKKKFL